MKSRPVLILAFALCLAGLGSRLALERLGAPDPQELVSWEAWESIGEPPYDRPLLLDFAADWCQPCVRLQVTVFRDPRFVELIEDLGLRPVRARYETLPGIEFHMLQERFGVDGLPALVVIARDGRFAPPLVGSGSTSQYEDALPKLAARLDESLFWSSPSHDFGIDGQKLTLRLFSSWFLLPREARQNADWRINPSPAFSQWASEHLHLVGDEFRVHMDGYGYYQLHGIRSVPTLVVETPDGRELTRFVGNAAIESAPNQLPRIAAEHGFDIPSPPTPFASR